MDASVAVKCLVLEDGSSDALAVLATQDGLAAPGFILIEVANVFWKKVRRGEVTEEQAGEALARLPSFFDRLLPAASLGNRPFRLATAMNHSVYDCTYLAVAELIDGTVVSADQHFVTRASAKGHPDRVISLQTFASRQPTLPKGH